MIPLGPRGNLLDSHIRPGSYPAANLKGSSMGAYSPDAGSICAYRGSPAVDPFAAAIAIVEHLVTAGGEEEAA